MAGTLSDDSTPVRASGFRGDVVRRRRVPGFVLTEIRHRGPSKSRSHEHGPAYFSRLTGGSYRERDEAGEIPYRVGAVRFHPVGYRHGDEIGPAGARFLCIELGEEMENDLSRIDALGPRMAPPASESARLISAIGREMRSGDPAGDFMLEGLALQLLGAFVRLPVEDETPAWLRRVAERLREECSRPLRLADLAAEAGVHPVHLARAYRRHYHRSVGEELRRYRVDAVRAKLASGDFSLAAAAAESGFADQSHMSRVFRRHVGMSPADFRRIAQARAGDVREVPRG